MPSVRQSVHYPTVTIATASDVSMATAHHPTRCPMVTFSYISHVRYNTR